MTTNVIYEFCNRHNISKLDMRYRDTELRKFGFSAEPPTVYYTVEIPDYELQTIAEFDRIWAKMQEEERARQANPAVLEAYEAYKLLLNLSQKGSDSD